MDDASSPNGLKQAQDLAAEIDGELAKVQAQEKVSDQLRRSALTDLRTELRKLAEVLGTERHRLVFIGQVGVGKTTAICHLVGLTADREKRKTAKNGSERVIHVTEDLMATGAGFTTLCEVIVIPGERNRFIVDPYPRDEVERTLADFCLTTWKRVYPDVLQDASQGAGSGADQVNFPPELVRAVRNMIRLPEGEKRDDDAAVRLAREFGPDAFDQFQADVVARAKLDGRVLTEFDCPATEADVRSWIKRTFDDLNLARLDTVSIPRRITLIADAKLLSPQMARVAAVVDTKGVDAAQFNREDLDRHIRDETDAVCVLAEGFDTAPSNVTPLLQRHVTPGLPLSLSKFALLVIPRNGEPEKKVGGQGPVGDRDIGINLLRNQIDETLSSRGIQGLNVVFFDPLRHFEAAGIDYRLHPDSDPGEVLADRDEVWAAIFSAIQCRHDEARSRVAAIGDSLKKIRDGKGLNPHEETLVKETRAKVAEHRHVNLANADRFLELYRRLWEGPGSRHPMTLRATNNRFGLYPPRNIDIYYDAVPITEQLVRTAVSRSKDAVLEIIRNVRNSAPAESDLHELFAVLEGRIESSFEQMVRHVGAAVRTFLQENAFAPQDASNPFWVGVQGRYGRGPGYREDVLSMYADELDGHESALSGAAEEAWQRIVIDPILEYLG